MVRKVLLDANVLWSPQQRNLLLQIASQDLFDAYWTDLIVEEWLRNVGADQRAKSERITLPRMREYFPNAGLPPMTPAPFGCTHVGDRHVAAAAVHVTPSILLTWNLQHFDAEALRRHGVEVMTPDALLVLLYDEKPEIVMETVREAQGNLTKSAPTWEDYMSALSTNKLRLFVGRLIAHDVRDEPLVALSDPDEDDPKDGPGLGPTGT